MSPEKHDSELTAFARALATLAPAKGQLDRDQVLFRAGQVALRRRAWLWPSVAAVLALLLGAAGLSEVLRPSPQRVQCTVYQRVEPSLSPSALWADKQPAHGDTAPPGAEEPDRQTDPLSYLHLQRLVLAWGVDGLPNPLAAASSGEHKPVLTALATDRSLNDWFRMQGP
jgi:hypothetical protein